MCTLGEYLNEFLFQSKRLQGQQRGISARDQGVYLAGLVQPLWLPFGFCLHGIYFSGLLLSFFIRASGAPYGSSWARDQIGAAAASLQHSHIEPHLRPVLQPAATLDPYPTERGRGSNLYPQGHYVRFLTC